MDTNYVHFILGVPLPKSECMACKSSIGLPDIQFICTCVLDINQDTEPNTLKKKNQILHLDQIWSP